MRITCKDGRVFTSPADFQAHFENVHARDRLVFAKFEVEGAATVVAVPWNAPLSLDEGDVNYGQDTCEDCAANRSASRIPIHPGCACSPAAGWDDYIAGLEQPEDTSDQLWAEFLKYLKQASRGRV